MVKPDEGRITKADILAAKKALDEAAERGEVHKIGPDDTLEDFFTPEEAETIQAIAEEFDPDA